MKDTKVVLEVSDLVYLVNNLLDLKLNKLFIQGEVSNFTISRGRFVYFNINDSVSTIRCFGIYGPEYDLINEGDMIELFVEPKLHQKYGFSLNVLAFKKVDVGQKIKDLERIRKVLEADGLFDVARKRNLPIFPNKIVLITSNGSAAEADFLKISKQRWPNIQITSLDTVMQGNESQKSVINNIDIANTKYIDADLLCIARGGGSKEDLDVFNSEELARHIASSRLITVVSIGHESDISFAELVADLRASTPSNAAEMIVPDQKSVLMELDFYKARIDNLVVSKSEQISSSITGYEKRLDQTWQLKISHLRNFLNEIEVRIQKYNVEAILNKGYILPLMPVSSLRVGAELRLMAKDLILNTKVMELIKK